MKYSNLSVLFTDETTLTFTDAVMMLSGNNLVITEHNEAGTSMTGRVYPLSTVTSYKAGKE
jgi:hypothetical protein